MSEIKVNKITPRAACGTTQLGDSGDTFTIPSGATITNSGTATGFGATGEISWDTTVKTTGTFTAAAGVGYFLNTTAGIITVNLPAGSAGDSIAMVDYAGTWDTYNVTVAPNGAEKIGGVAADAVLSTEGQSVTLVYIDGTQGWVNVLDSTSNIRGNPYIIATGGCITTCGNDKIHTFLSPNTFTVCTAALCAADNVVSYMVVAGGGGGGWDVAGGGGAGGYREVVSPSSPYTGSPIEGYPTPGNRITVSATPYPIGVGGGGAGATSGPTPAVAGVDSTFSTITSAGGGFGGSHPGNCGTSGGSGGGGAGHNTTTIGGLGNTPPVSPAQGFKGGDAQTPSAFQTGGGGGGATAAGSCSVNPPSAPTFTPRAAGATTSISTAPTEYAQGGRGANDAATPAVAGGCNTGTGGDGSGSPCTGASGGSGIVIIRYRYQ